MPKARHSWRTRSGRGHTVESAIACFRHWEGCGLRKQVRWVGVAQAWYLDHVEISLDVLHELESLGVVWRSDPETFDLVAGESDG